MDRALQIDPNNVATWIQEGLALNGLGKYNEAIQWFDKVLQIDPNLANAWYNKGFVLKKLGKRNEAKQCFDKAKQLGFKKRRSFW